MECQGRIQTEWGRKSKCTHCIKALKSSHLQEKKSYSLGRSLFFPCVYCTAVSFHSMGVKILASPHLVIISYTVTKPKKMPFYVMNYSENTLTKVFYRQLNSLLLVKRHQNLKDTLPTLVFIVSLLLYIYGFPLQASSFQDFSFSHLPPTASPAVPSGVASFHFLVMVFRTNFNSTVFLSLKIKEKLLPLLQSSALGIRSNSSLLKVFIVY